MTFNLTFLFLDEGLSPVERQLLPVVTWLSWLKVRKKIDLIRLCSWTLWLVKIVISLNNISFNFFKREAMLKKFLFNVFYVVDNKDL